MTIEITLFGFGDDRPPRFGSANRLRLDLETPTTPRAVLRAAGIDDDTGLVLMNRDVVIPAQHWDDSIIKDQERLTLLSAFEGG